MDVGVWEARRDEVQGTDLNAERVVRRDLGRDGSTQAIRTDRLRMGAEAFVLECCLVVSGAMDTEIS